MYTVLILLNLYVNRFFHLLFTRFLRVFYSLSRYVVTCVLLVRIGIKPDKNLKTTLIIVCAWSDSGQRVPTTPLELISNAVGFRRLGHRWWYGG